jgi:hypothetical protein
MAPAMLLLLSIVYWRCDDDDSPGNAMQSIDNGKGQKSYSLAAVWLHTRGS